MLYLILCTAIPKTTVIENIRKYIAVRIRDTKNCSIYLSMRKASHPIKEAAKMNNREIQKHLRNVRISNTLFGSSEHSEQLDYLSKHLQVMFEVESFNIKQTNQAREAYAQAQQDRKRNALVLFMSFLRSEGYAASVTALEVETNVTLQKFEVCDNVDIMSIIAEYEEYYKFKFNHPAKLVKKIEPQSAPPRQPEIPKKQTPAKLPPKKPENNERSESEPKLPDVLPQIPTKQILDKDVKRADKPQKPEEKDDAEKEEFRPVFHAAPANFPPELLPFYEIVRSEIIQEHPAGGFDQVVGLARPKQVLKESIILPQKYPELFTGILRPWKGCLAFSAPGNGKSFLARALAAECRCVFFNVSAATLLSKYFGDSEKLVRCLFLMARQYERAVIFVDELDCLMTQRADQEHEASRRIKTQLLVEIDGLLTENSQVFVLAATNLPWSIDAAMLRRLEKRVYFESPNVEARKLIVQKQIGDRISQEQTNQLAEQTEHWSASDVCALCKEAAMRRLRVELDRLEAGTVTIDKVQLQVQQVDVEGALASVRPSYNLEMQKKYEAWAREYGA